MDIVICYKLHLICKCVQRFVKREVEMLTQVQLCNKALIVSIACLNVFFRVITRPLFGYSRATCVVIDEVCSVMSFQIHQIYAYHTHGFHPVLVMLILLSSHEARSCDADKLQFHS